MITSVLRVLIGFVLACAAGALVKLAFAGPDDVFTSDVQKLSWTGQQVLLAGTHSIVFSAPFALVAAAIGEWLSLRGWLYYALAGIAIAIAGLFAVHSAEADPQVSILNNYGVAAFLTSGLVGGLVYWLLSGRLAGDPPVADVNASSPDTSSNDPQPEKPRDTELAEAKQP